MHGIDGAILDINIVNNSLFVLKEQCQILSELGWPCLARTLCQGAKSS